MNALSNIKLPCKVQAIYSWGGEQDDDLGFIEGDLIEVDSFGDGKWWHGKSRRNKMTGNFPSNYVKFLDVPLETKIGNSAVPATAGGNNTNSSSTPVSKNNSSNNSVNNSRLSSTLRRDHDVSDISVGSIEMNNTISEISSNDIEEQIQKLRQLQQLQHLQNELQKSRSMSLGNHTDLQKSQLVKSLSTPQNLNYLVESLNEFIKQQSGPVTSPQVHSATSKMPPPYPTQRNDLKINQPHVPLVPHVPEPSSHIAYQFQAPGPHMDSREFSNTSTVKPLMDYKNSDTQSISSVSSSEFAPPPPPPPAHRIPVRSYTSTNERQNLDVSRSFYHEKSNNTSFILPYDPDTLNQSRSDVYELPQKSDDLSSASGTNYFNSNESVTGSISTAVTDFSATSAGSYFRHKMTSLPPIPTDNENEKNEDNDEDDELRLSFMKSKYYRRVSAEDHYKYKGQISKLNEDDDSKSNDSDPKEVIPNERNSPLDVIFVEEKKNKKSTSKFLKKLFLKETNNQKAVSNPLNNANGLPPQTLKNNQFADLSFESSDAEASWIENKIDINRSTTINGKDFKVRQKRALENEKYLILEPQKLLTEVNSNEVVPIAKYGPVTGKVDFDKDFKNIDNFVRNLKNVPYISPNTFISNEIAIKFSDELDRIRACYVFCCEKMHLIESNEIIDIRNSPAKHINNIFQSRSGTVYQLAWLMKVFLDALKIPNDLIIGYLKKPDLFNNNLSANHVWNSVLINNEWRFVDCGLANVDGYLNQMLRKDNDPIYFLTKPLELIHTHIPTLIEQQHISPPLDSMIALALPSCYPQFFRNNLKIKKFNNALTRLQDLEVFEIVLEVPKDVEVFCSVKAEELSNGLDKKAQTTQQQLQQSSSIKKIGSIHSSSSSGNGKKLIKSSSQNLSIAQIFWKANVKFCRIKSVLPEGASKGILEIYSGKKGEQKTLTNIHPLSLTIPLYHQGESRELQFVTRYPTIHCQSHDLYVKEPQIKSLNLNATYIFKILQHPSMGITSSSGFMKTKLALQSPTGKIIKLRKKDVQHPFGTWEASVTCDEVGTWKGLVVTDGGVAWCVFVEWFCA